MLPSPAQDVFARCAPTGVGPADSSAGLCLEKVSLGRRQGQSGRSWWEVVAPGVAGGDLRVLEAPLPGRPGRCCPLLSVLSPAGSHRYKPRSNRLWSECTWGLGGGLPYGSPVSLPPKIKVREAS